MKHLIVLTILLNWFFAFRVPTENRPGVFFTFVKGPYENELECWEDHDEAKEMFLSLGVDEADLTGTGCVGDATQKV